DLQIEAGSGVSQAKSGMMKIMKIRFTLGALLTVVAIVAVAFAWIASQRNFVRERQQFLSEIKALDGRTLSQLELDELDSKAALIIPEEQNSPQHSVSFIRRFFGDKGYLFIILPKDADGEMVRRANYLYPEVYLRQFADNHSLIDIKQK